MYDLPLRNDSRNHRSAGILIWMNEKQRHRVLTLRFGGFCATAARWSARRRDGWLAMLGVPGSRRNPVPSIIGRTHSSRTDDLQSQALWIMPAVKVLVIGDLEQVPGAGIKCS